MKIYSQIMLLLLVLEVLHKTRRRKKPTNSLIVMNMLALLKHLSLVENGNNSAYVYEHLADSYYKIETQLMPKMVC
jgi:hypothetical protein